MQTTGSRRGGRQPARALELEGGGRHLVDPQAQTAPGHGLSHTRLAPSRDPRVAPPPVVHTGKIRGGILPLLRLLLLLGSLVTPHPTLPVWWGPGKGCHHGPPKHEATGRGEEEGTGPGALHHPRGEPTDAVPQITTDKDTVHIGA